MCALSCLLLGNTTCIKPVKIVYSSLESAFAIRKWGKAPESKDSEIKTVIDNIKPLFFRVQPQCPVTLTEPLQQRLVRQRQDPALHQDLSWEAWVSCALGPAPHGQQTQQIPNTTRGVAVNWLRGLREMSQPQADELLAVSPRVTMWVAPLQDLSLFPCAWVL